MNIGDFLIELCNASGVSGYENNLSEKILEAFEPHCQEITSDKLGSLIAVKKGLKKDKNIKIMLAAHMDEIGLIVKDIEESGFIRFTRVGGFDPRTLLGQEVIIHGREDVYGVIGAKPPHLQDPSERKKAMKMEDLTIDVGFTKEEVLNKVRIGDVITIKRKALKLQGDVITGKSLDDRAGVVTMYECLMELTQLKHEADVYFVATVQEEVGVRGATVSTYKIEPDIGIAIDVGFGATPELPKEDTIDMGKGPAITMGGNIHPTMRKKIVELAKEYNIPFQNEVAPGASGTDAVAMQITRAGVPCLLISLPLRYMHTSVETIDLNDLKNAGKLLARFIAYVTSDNLEGLLCY